MWTQNVLSFFAKYQPYFQMALGVWQILQFTPPAAVIKGVMGRLLSFALPGFFPAYEQLRDSPGCLFKTVKCVVLTKGKSQSKTKPPAKPQNQVTTTYHRSACEHSAASDQQHLSSTVDNPNPQPDFPEIVVPKHQPDFPEIVVPKHQSDIMSVDYLGKPFEVKREGKREEKREVYVNEEMSYYISDRQWNRILKMQEKCFMKKAGKGRSEKENEVVFVKGHQLIWQKVATGKIMEFGEVLDDVILENKDTVLISDDVWFLPVDLSEKLEGKLPKLLNLVGMFFSTHQKTSLLLAKSFSIASAILEFCKPLRLLIFGKINKMFCWSVQYICNKLPYPVRRFVYLLFIWVENLMPRNDIRLKVVRCDYLNVVIGGSAKINSAQEATHVEWLDKAEKYQFQCGCSIVMKATYDNGTEICEATMQHTNAVFSTVEERLFLKCQSREEFMRIGTFLWCLSTSKAGSLFKYDRNDNIVHVRNWRGSLRHYAEAGFPEIYKLRLHDVIV